MAYIFPTKIFPETLNKYIQCPFKFKCYNDREIKREFIENTESFVGKVIHLVLRHFFDIRKVPIDKRREQDIGELVRYFWVRIPKDRFNRHSRNYWNEEDRRRLFGSEEQEKAFGLQAIAILNNYITNADLSVTPLFLEDWIDCQVDEFIISGRVDRIDQDSETAISVWDYKTGKLPYHDSIEEMMEEDVQVPIYAIIASKRNPFAEKIRGGLIYVKYSKVYDKVWTKNELGEVENRIVNIIKKARDDNDLLPRINQLCPWCEYREVCPEKDKIEQSYTKIDEVNW